MPAKTKDAGFPFPNALLQACAHGRLCAFPRIFVRVMKKKVPKIHALRSPVARAMHGMTKCATHRNRKSDYQRQPKHRDRNPG
jgi:hypothetical protein